MSFLMKEFFQETQKNLQNQTKNISKSVAEISQKNLEDIGTMVEEIQEQFKDETTQKLTKEFLRIKLILFLLVSSFCVKY